jgi:hypothetical protein
LALLGGSNGARPSFEQLDIDEHKKLINLINYSLESIAKKLSPDEFLILTRAYIRIAYDAVQNAKEPFEGMGKIRQIHSRNAIESISMTSTCMLRLRELLNTTPHLPREIAQFREQLVLEITRVRALIGLEGSYSQHRLTKAPKEDVKNRLKVLLQKLDELDRHIQGQDLPW